jgi:hypothetical protein
VFNFSLISLLRISFVFAQINTTNILGTVKDKVIQSPIEGALVTLLNADTSFICLTDRNGAFIFKKVPLNAYQIKITNVAYNTQIVDCPSLDLGRNTIVNIEMDNNLYFLQEVEVKAKKDSNTFNPSNNLYSLNIEQAKNYAFTLNDPSRIVQILPSVNSTNDQENTISVRGNSPTGILWRVEGIDIQNPNHFSLAGSNTGTVSVFAENTLEKLDFYTSAFPAQYGNATSSVMDIKLKNGNMLNRQFSASLGLLGLKLGAEGPLKKGNNITYNFNYRLWSVGFLKSINFYLPSKPFYQDGLLTVNVPHKKGYSKFFALFSMDSLVRTINVLPNNYVNTLLTVGNNNQFNLGTNDNLQISLAISYLNNAYFDGYKNTSSYYTSSYKTSNLFSSITYTHKINFKNSINIGLNNSLNNVNYDKFNYKNNLKTNEETQEKGISDLIQNYISYKYTPNYRINLLIGVHGLYFSGNKQINIEPRGMVSYDINTKFQINFAFGNHSKVENLLLYLPTNPNKNLGFTKSLHFQLGNRIKLNNLTLQTDAYYQHLYDVPINQSFLYSSINQDNYYTTGFLTNNGSGTNLGIESFVEYKKNTFYFILSSSVYNSTYKLNDDVVRNSKYNGQFVFKALSGKSFIFNKNKKQYTLNLNARLNYLGGYYLEPITLNYTSKGVYETTLYGQYNQKSPNYFRADFQIRLKKDNKSITQIWSLDINNVTNYQNVLDAYFDSVSKTVRYNYQLGFLPVLNYQILF